MWNGFVIGSSATLGDEWQLNLCAVVYYTCNIERDGLALVGHFGATPEDGSTSHDAWLFRLSRRSSNQQPIFEKIK